jgi:hypothetical protein
VVKSDLEPWQGKTFKGEGVGCCCYNSYHKTGGKFPNLLTRQCGNEYQLSLGKKTLVSQHLPVSQFVKLRMQIIFLQLYLQLETTQASTEQLFVVC